METIPDIIRGFRAADGEVLRIAGAEAEPFAAVDPRHLRVEAAAGASARIVVLHTAPDVSSLTLTLAEGAQLELTELFTAEAFAEVSVKQSARSLPPDDGAAVERQRFVPHRPRRCGCRKRAKGCSLPRVKSIAC